MVLKTITDMVIKKNGFLGVEPQSPASQVSTLQTELSTNKWNESPFMMLEM
jgi:hypothetical protein